MACAHFHQPLSQLLASAQCCAVASDTAPLVMFCTGGALGTCSNSSSFTGGTIVTPYGAHIDWHAGGTLSMEVVVFTAAHAPSASFSEGAVMLGGDDGDALSVATPGVAPQPEATSIQAAANAIASNPLTLTPKLSSRRTDSGRTMPARREPPPAPGSMARSCGRSVAPHQSPFRKDGRATLIW